MENQEFATLLRRAKRGDRRALDEALQAMSNHLRAAASRQLRPKLRGALSTSDLLQSTYLDVVRSIHAFRGEDEISFQAWLNTVLENNVRQKVRAQGRDKRRGPDGMRIDPDEVVAETKTPSRCAIEVESLTVVAKALESLAPDHRQVIEARLINGEDYAVIAASLDRSEGAIRMLYLRARAALALEIDRMLGP